MYALSGGNISATKMSGLCSQFDSRDGSCPEPCPFHCALLLQRFKSSSAHQVAVYEENKQNIVFQSSLNQADSLLESMNMLLSYTLSPLYQLYTLYCLLGLLNTFQHPQVGMQINSLYPQGQTYFILFVYTSTFCGTFGLLSPSLSVIQQYLSQRSFVRITYNDKYIENRRNSA